ncbi:hypothetical protein H6G89_11075 [Oscillatoria sp. FACHB-1407]|uniref:hypothetical protein n=1 Tax=Oscillatoria sp. FACHB-1407 TaxID=2692847 RepID=UPI001685355A|nr:hypothetical protein [Oscillatoria sp. FACHB-1407]MBD2461592.1 hypothetical protein [Oscillatoria sp. FACHB-1407]
MLFSPPSPTKVQRFLDLIDRLSDALGASVPPFVNLEELRSLPVGTLGHAWAESLDRHHLAPFTTGPRRKQLHDGIHVLTGYGTDPIGEAEVQAFLLGSKFRPVHLVLGLGLLNAIAHQHPSWQMVKTRLWNAYDRGRRSSFDVDRWEPEHLWSVPLEEVQRYYRL